MVTIFVVTTIITTITIIAIIITVTNNVINKIIFFLKNIRTYGIGSGSTDSDSVCGVALAGDALHAFPPDIAQVK